MHKRDFCQEIPNQIIEMLEMSTDTYNKPWAPGDVQFPFNPTTQKAYRSDNALHHMLDAVRKGTDDPRKPTWR